MSDETLRYIAQDSCQSLSEGLAEYYARNADLLDPSRLPSDVEILFRQHDAGHVVFGCDTSLRGETLVDTWTVAGTTAGVRGYLRYFRYPQVSQIFSDAGYGRIAAEFARCLPDVLRVLARSRRLSARWPWAHYEQYLEQRLADIRCQFNIRVV